jgi:hypothetical protein
MRITVVSAHPPRLINIQMARRSGKKLAMRASLSS